ncbi:MAG: PfkB family carbohydrate kinase [bacterium]
MSLLVVGSVAFDSVQTPFGKVDDVLGGSELYFSTSASYFTDVQLVAVVGDDFPDEPVEFLRSRNVDVAGLHRAEGKTFRWKGEYGFDLNEAKTLETHLNVFSTFQPNLPANYRDAKNVFLANIDPELQLEVLNQVKSPEFVAMDTMNFWINGKIDELRRTLKHIDMLVINEGEARALSGEANIVKAAAAIRSYGPKHLVVKRGEYGALLFSDDDVFFAPAYPLEAVFDPTGAGDTFAGGMIGYLARCGDRSSSNMRLGTVFGCVMASFVVEQFSFDALRGLNDDSIRRRFDQFRSLVTFDHLDALAAE